MSAQVTVFLGPSLAARRERLLVEFRAAARRRIGAALWIGPTPEAVDEARRRLLTDGKTRAIVGPQLYDWQSLARLVVRRLDPALRCVGPVRQRLLLDAAIGALKRAGRLPHFERIADSRGFHDAAAGMLSEFTSVGIDPGGASGGTPTLADAAAIFERYRALLAEQGLLDADRLLPVALDYLRRAGQNPIKDVESIFLDAGVAMGPVEWSLVQELTRYAARLWIAHADGPDDRRDEFFRIPRASIAAIRGVYAAAEFIELSDEESCPAGLRHLRRTLFDGVGTLSLSNDAAGLSLIEAPGIVGEARLIARRIRQLLGSGAAPDDIIVAARRPEICRDVVDEVFTEYGIAIDVTGDVSLHGNPLVAALVRAARLPDDDWSFAGVTALLRNGFFRPRWWECAHQPELPRHAEALLRLLGEPKGKESVLRAVDVWADAPPAGLEDEQAEEPQRGKKTRLARQCRSFLRRFYAAWDRFPLHGAPAQYLQALRSLADDLGFTGKDCEEDRLALLTLWRKLENWLGAGPSSPMSRADFLRQLGLITGVLSPRRREAAGRIRFRGAEEASVLQADYLFVMGLGEKSFPDLSPPDSLLDDAARHELRAQGLPLPNPEDPLAREMLLFHQLVSMPRKELVFSFAAVDEKGQPLLPSSFLRAARDCFADGAIRVERQRMLIEDYTTRLPIAASELRVQFAAARASSALVRAKWQHPRLSEELTAHLRDAARMARGRFAAKEFGAYDGWLSDPRILDELAARYGPEKTFSPTALETYAACPMRFFLDSVLGLEPLDEPVEEVEHTRRGAAFHRALARFHRKLLDENRTTPADSKPEELQEQIAAAVDEYRNRAPSEAARVLWQLEGQRLQRCAARYHAHWQSFVAPWQERATIPAPARIEAAFGLPVITLDGERLDPDTQALTIRAGDVEVRVAGRIDRIDVAQLEDGLGFWVIDYKTGRSTHFSGEALSRLEKLQLSLYALAVERVFFPGQAVRPLGLAYWMVAEAGPKPVLPDRYNRFAWLDAPEKWQRFRDQLEQWVAMLVGQIRAGQFPLWPKRDNCTETCDYSQICRIAQGRRSAKGRELSLPVLPPEPAAERS